MFILETAGKLFVLCTAINSFLWTPQRNTFTIYSIPLSTETNYIQKQPLDNILSPNSYPKIGKLILNSLRVSELRAPDLQSSTWIEILDLTRTFAQERIDMEELKKHKFYKKCQGPKNKP